MPAPVRPSTSVKPRAKEVPKPPLVEEPPIAPAEDRRSEAASDLPTV
jgi:hypothetical protein